MTLDAIVILLILLSIFIGYKIGIMRFILKLASIFSGIIITFVLITPVHSFVMNSSIGENKTEEIYLQIQNDSTMSEMFESLESSKLTTFFFEKIIVVDTETSDLAMEVATSMTSIVLWIQLFIILFVTFAIIVFIIKSIVRRVREHTAVRLVDGLIGIVFSLMTFQLIIYLLLSAVLVASSFDVISGADSFLEFQNNESIGIFTYFYENNFIYHFIILFF